MASVTSQLVPLESNFLVPNVTFFVELAAFAVLFFLLAKFVIPPINRAMTRRQEAIRQEFDELEEAKADARKAEEDFKAQLADARHEAARIREEAREQGAAIIAELREQAQDGRRSHHRARPRPDRGRAQGRHGLAARRGGRPGHVARRADRRGEPRGRRAEHPRRRPVPRRPRDAGGLRGRGDGRDPLMLRGASADALATLTDKVRSARTLADAEAMGDELFAVAVLLRSDPALRRVVTDASLPAEVKQSVVESLLGGKVGDDSFAVVTERRRSSLDGAARPARLARTAERDRGRPLGGRQGRPAGRRALRRGADAQGEPRPAGRPLQPRTVGRRPGEAGRDHLRSQGAAGHGDAGQAGPGRHLPHRRRRPGGLPRGGGRDRGRARGHGPGGRAAHGRRPDRLQAALARQYGRDVHINEVVDPDVMGGIRVELGDDVIDGTVSSRIDDARRRLVG